MLALSLSLPLSFSPLLSLCPDLCLSGRKGSPQTRKGGDSSDESARPASLSSNRRRVRCTLAGRDSPPSIRSSPDGRLRSSASPRRCRGSERDDANAAPCTCPLQSCRNPTELPPSARASTGLVRAPVAERVGGNRIITVSDATRRFPSKRSDIVLFHLWCESERPGRTWRRQSCRETKLVRNTDRSNQLEVGSARKDVRCMPKGSSMPLWNPLNATRDAECEHPPSELPRGKTQYTIAS